MLSSHKTFGMELVNLLDVGELIWKKGWAEANAGNVSLRLPENLVKEHEALLSSLLHDTMVHKDIKVPELSWFMISATGSRYRDYKKTLFDNFVLAVISDSETENNKFSERIVFPCHRKPTSEWVTHSLIQKWLIQNRCKDKVILHTHPTDWIVISSLPEYQKDKAELEQSIRKCLPEIDIYFPGGVGLLPYDAPGSLKLARSTMSVIDSCNAIVWERHGVLITAESIDIAFDYLEILSKAAAVYLQVRKLH